MYSIQTRYLYTIKEKRVNLLDAFLNDNNIKPWKIYNNLHLNETATNLRNDTKNVSGVYLIFNNISGDYYVGSSSTNKFYSRFYRHLINFTGSKIVKLAVRKHKLKNFSFLILELFPEITNKENNKKLLDLEDFYLKSLLPNYNILTEAGSNFGYKHIETDRIKIKTNYSQQRRDKIGNLNKGETLSLTKSKIREKVVYKNHSEYTKEAVLNMKNSKPIKLFNKDGTLYGEYTSIKHVANSIKCECKAITKALNSQSKLLMKRWVIKNK